MLVDLNRVLKEDVGLELNVSKTSILPKVITQQDMFDVTHNFIVIIPPLTQWSGDVTLPSVWPEGFIGIGVTIGTDTFVRNFVPKTCRTIIDDVENLDASQDGFVHYQLIRFFQDTRLQYTNSHILLTNRYVL